MTIDAATLKALVDKELEGLRDARVERHVRALLVEPRPVMRPWTYGEPGEKLPCWTVLDDLRSETGIAYCEFGFGPHRPWGLVWLRHEDRRHLSMGQDSAWFATFLDAFFDSAAATPLPIWRVFRGPWARLEPLTGEGSWDEAWQRVAEFQSADPSSNYFCYHSIPYRRPTSD